MDNEHVTFAGLAIPELSEGEIQAMQLGFMWNAVVEFVPQFHFAFVMICLNERFGHVAMQMADRLGLSFKAGDGCRVDQIHVTYWRKVPE